MKKPPSSDVLEWLKQQESQGLGGKETELCNGDLSRLLLGFRIKFYYNIKEF